MKDFGKILSHAFIKTELRRPFNTSRNEGFSRPLLFFFGVEEGDTYRETSKSNNTQELLLAVGKMIIGCC